MRARSVEHWSRLIPHAQSTDIELGLRAEVADPLWLLARQYQLGELTGDDGGSAVAVDFRVSHVPFTRIAAGTQPGPGAPYDRNVPLEMQVEAEPVLRSDETRTAWAARIRAARELLAELNLRSLESVVRRIVENESLRLNFKESRAAAGGHAQTVVDGVCERRYQLLLGETAIDGLLLLRKHDAGTLQNELQTGLALSLEQRKDLQDGLKSWRTNLDRLWGVDRHDNQTWQRERLEYAFRVATPALRPDPSDVTSQAEPVLSATEYDGDGLAWFNVDLEIDPALALGAAGDPTIRDFPTHSAVPAPLTYPGGPADRFWEMEDAAVSLTALRASQTELSKLIALDFALVFSPDWLLIPIEVPIGQVASVDFVVVRDTFGHATLVGTHKTQAGDCRGRQFQPSLRAKDEGDTPLLAVLPSALGGLRSEPIEDVTLQRDEAANLMWAIEHRVEGSSGRSVELPWFQSEFDLPPLPASFKANHELIWRLATPVAKAWVPYVAAIGSDGAGGKARYLRRAQLQSTADGELRAARSRLLTGAKKIREEEVTRAGCRVTLLDQLARGVDGQVYVWRGRVKRPGRGEVSSGLSFDITTPDNTSPET